MLEGKNVNLRIMEKEDLTLFAEWNNDPKFQGEFEPLEQTSRTEVEKWYDTLRPEEKSFIIEKKMEAESANCSACPKALTTP